MEPQLSRARVPTLTDLPRRWTAADAARVFSALERSGLTDTEFARRSGIQPQRLRRWRRARTPVRLVEVVARAPTPPIEATVHAVTPTGWRIEVPANQLGELVRALAATSC